MDGEGYIEIINLKETPETVEKLVDGKSYFSGFHMNKKHWYTICLDGNVSLEKIYGHIDRSYSLINKNTLHKFVLLYGEYIKIL